MSKFRSKDVSAFSIQGRFLSFEFEDGYMKYLRLATSEGECCIKLCKELRSSFELRLIPGDWLQILGEKKLNRKTGKVKLKAERVIPATASNEQINVQPKNKQAKTKASILVCQKSSCMKRGGTEVCHALEAALSDRGLENQVAIKGTGCLKQCKAGPNLVMPDKTRYTQIQAAKIPEVIDRHFTAYKVDNKTHPLELAAMPTVSANSVDVVVK
jgi:(2Fe-2S) ferredoxin